MDCAKIGRLIRMLRCEKGLTQKQLADMMNISDKTISKWERGLGCPDVSLLPDLAALLEVNIDELLTGDLTPNTLEGGNMKNTAYAVCPVCGSITASTGQTVISCCGRRLEAAKPQKATEEKRLALEAIEDEWYITSSHPMRKDAYISFVAFATGSTLLFLKQYPEWDLQVRIPQHKHGILVWYSTEGGLLYQLI